MSSISISLSDNEIKIISKQRNSLVSNAIFACISTSESEIEILDKQQNSFVNNAAVTCISTNEIIVKQASSTVLRNPNLKNLSCIFFCKTLIRFYIMSTLGTNKKRNIGVNHIRHGWMIVNTAGGKNSGHIKEMLP